MKIEKISDNQIRCTLNRADLLSREIKLSELAYGTEKAKGLFRDMIRQASTQFGFEADDLPLMIEAIPISNDCIILIITKVDDPEELDTRFSKFAPSNEDMEDDADFENDDDIDEDDDIMPDFDSLYRKLRKSIEQTEEEDKDETINVSEDFIPIKDVVPILDSNSDSADEMELPFSEDDVKEVSLSRLFSFDSWDHASKAALDCGSLSENGHSRLYRKDSDERFFLLLEDKVCDTAPFFKLCSIISEYGNREYNNYATEEYFNEHCKVIIKDNALEILKKY